MQLIDHVLVEHHVAAMTKVVVEVLSEVMVVVVVEVVVKVKYNQW